MGSDFEEEVLVIAISVGDSLNDFDLVIDAIDCAGVERVLTVGENTVKTVVKPPIFGPVLMRVSGVMM